MENTAFWCGIGAGMVLGAAVGMAVSPRQRSMKTCVGRTMQHMGNAVDNAWEDFLHAIGVKFRVTAQPRGAEASRNQGRSAKGRMALYFWWRRRESNPRPKALEQDFLRAQSGSKHSLRVRTPDRPYVSVES